MALEGEEIATWDKVHPTTNELQKADAHKTIHDRRQREIQELVGQQYPGMGAAGGPGGGIVNPSGGTGGIANPSAGTGETVIPFLDKAARTGKGITDWINILPEDALDNPTIMEKIKTQLNYAGMTPSHFNQALKYNSPRELGFGRALGFGFRAWSRREYPAKAFTGGLPAEQAELSEYFRNWDKIFKVFKAMYPKEAQKAAEDFNKLYGLSYPE